MWGSLILTFQCPEEVRQALHQRVDHGIFGYKRTLMTHITRPVIEWFSKPGTILPLQREWFTVHRRGGSPDWRFLIQFA